MDILTKSQLVKTETKLNIFSKLNSGKLFIYPTDTIYGIGCDATNIQAVLNIGIAKKRENQAYSIIAPSKDWIRENCETNTAVETWLNKLPGPYTLILKLTNIAAVSSATNQGCEGTIGVRIPNHWIMKLITEYNKPIITTSANITCTEVIREIKDIHPDMRNRVDFAIDDGKLEGSASTIINLTGETEKVIKR